MSIIFHQISTKIRKLQSYNPTRSHKGTMCMFGRGNWYACNHIGRSFVPWTWRPSRPLPLALDGGNGDSPPPASCRRGRAATMLACLVPLSDSSCWALLTAHTLRGIIRPGCGTSHRPHRHCPPGVRHSTGFTRPVLVRVHGLQPPCNRTGSWAP